MSSDVAGQAVADSEETDSRMALKVEIKEIGACRKHISVTVPEADIRTIRDDAWENCLRKLRFPVFALAKFRSRCWKSDSRKKSLPTSSKKC